MGKLSDYLRHRLLWDLLAVIAGRPDRSPGRQSAARTEPRSIFPPADPSDEWPLMDDGGTAPTNSSTTERSPDPDR